MVMGRNECGSNAMVTVQTTVEEYLEMKSRQEAKEVTSKQKNLVYGLEGIKTLFGCSPTRSGIPHSQNFPTNSFASGYPKSPYFHLLLFRL